MLKRFFVTGTDTSVGKTVVSRALLQALAARGKRVAGYKPVAKGSKETPEGLRNKDAGPAKRLIAGIALSRGQSYCVKRR
jgi:dethiobiotin synthetase